MSRHRLRLATVVGAVVAALLSSVVPAHAAVTLSVGHVDAAWTTYVNGNLQLGVGDHTVMPSVIRDPADVILRALPGTKKTVPNPASPACLGAPGADVWILPQIEDPNLLWLGWSASGISSGVLDNNKVFLNLTSVTPPVSGAGFCVYSVDALGNKTVLFYNLNGLPDSVSIPVGPTGHKHVSWAFTASGTWTAKFKLTATVGGAPKSSPEKTYTFSVG